MILESHTRSILEAALQAPSGENSQPWRFRVEGNIIHLYHNPLSDQSLYNFKNYGSYVAHGAAIENMSIAATALGYHSIVTLFPNPLDPNQVASLTINKSPHDSDQKTQDLYKAIKIRTSNRKPYKTDTLVQEHATALEATTRVFETDGPSYLRVTDRETIHTLATIGASNEEIMLQNKALHDFFFSHLTWTKEEDERKKVGFYIRTLELPTPVRFLFKLFACWPVMVWGIAIGFPTSVRYANTLTNASASEFGIIYARGDTPSDFILTGRMLERIWLTATSCGVQMQPLTGTVFMNFFIKENPEGHFTERERTLIRKQIDTLYTIVGGGKVVTFMFRAGYAPAASARASRFALEELLLS